MSKKIISSETCELLSTLLHFIPSNEYQLRADTEALCHDVRTALALPGVDPLEVENPWREFIENCMTGENYFRTSEYQVLLEDLDRLYTASQPAPAPEPVQVTNAMLQAGKKALHASNSKGATEKCKLIFLAMMAEGDKL